MARWERWSAGAGGLLALLVLLPGGAARAAVAETRHNLSVNGPFPVRSTTLDEICAFCHSPHDAFSSVPLFNHQPATQPALPYSSATLNSAPRQPEFASGLCFACHSGTSNLGALLNLDAGPVVVPMQNTAPDGSMPPGRTNLGVDLTNDHPVSIPYNAPADGELAPPETHVGVGLKPGSDPTFRSVQCSSCHDPHGTAFPLFLRAPTTEADICLRCHAKPGWVGSSHQSSLIVFPQGSTTTVRSLGCLACHTPHNSPPGSPRLLREGAAGGQPALEQVCFRCHSPASAGGVAPDVQTEINKRTRHPVAQYPGHETVFTVASPPEPTLNRSRHVECTDCHNPHRVTAQNRVEGMRGITFDGSEAEDVTVERDARNLAGYEVCLRCHGDTVADVIPNPTQSGAVPGNKRLEFQPSNSAFHPVAAQGRNTSPNLAEQLASAGLSPNDTILCVDCHNTDATGTTRGRASNYTGPAATGPHGSANPSILRANYRNTYLAGENPTSFSAANFALCFLCHDVGRLVTPRRFEDGARTNFYSNDDDENLHWVHLVDRADDARASCKNCHFNPHSNQAATNTIYRINGQDFTTPPPGTDTHLVSFSPDIQGTVAARPLWVFNTASRTRQCFLQCHGAEMEFSYSPPSGDDPNPNGR